MIMNRFITLLVVILCILEILTMVSAYGDNGPLYISYIEKYNITATATVEGVKIESYNITGYIIINNTASDINDTLSDVWIAVNVSNNVTPLTVDYDLTTAPKADSINISSEPPAYTGLIGKGNVYIHIPILPNNTWVAVKFGINKSIGGVPIIVSEKYSLNKVPAQRDWNFTIYINLSRNISALPSTNTEVYLSMTKYLSNSSSDYGNGNWTFLNITKVENSTGSYVLWDGPYFTGTANDSLNWTGIILNISQNASINITVEENNTFPVNRSGYIIPADFGFAVIKFIFNGTISNTTIAGVYATGNGVIQALKEGPYYNSSTGTFNIWYERANFTNLAKTYSFNLTNLTLWAVNGSNPTIVDPFNISLLIPGSKHVFGNPLPIILNPGDYWNTSKYSYTFDGVPVVWANCTFTVVDSNITLLNYSMHEDNSKYGSSYIIIEKIYVVGGYLLKVTKHIIPNSDGTYDIYIVVENIGSAKTPEYVYVYDLIPKNFTRYDDWVNQSSMVIYNTTIPLYNNPRYNYSLIYALHSIYPGADGDGDWNDATEILKNQTVVIHYKLNGTGTFYPSDVFIVGIDPTNSLLPTTSPKISAVSGAIENNYEPILALLTAILGLELIIRLKKYAL
ncbi:hypothetical protein ACO3TA_04735 [Methanocaldococcus sp. 28A]